MSRRECRTWRKGLWVEEYRPPLEVGQGKEIASPSEPPGEHSSADFMASHGQKHKPINVCCFKPLRLWSFVRAAVGN